MPKLNEVVVNKTIEAYPFVITLEKVEKTPYFEISKLKTLVKIYFKLKNIGEVEHLLNIDNWKLTFSGGTDNGNLIMSKITGDMILKPGSYVSGYVVFDDVSDASQYTLEIEIPKGQKTLKFELKLPNKIKRKRIMKLYKVHVYPGKTRTQSKTPRLIQHFLRLAKDKKELNCWSENISKEKSC